MDFASVLLNWYRENGRVLPWRGSHDPYLIWVSEVIFQQTRIEQGTGYFLRFTARFSTIVDLAEAEEDEVLKLWQGLGYYSRARNMHYTARHICENYEGKFPRDFGTILKLKGIGDYTASCISSICFGEPHAAVDGNVYRVLSRFYADNTSIDGPSGKSHFKRIAQELISRERPGDFNEALMDLGATVCKPRSPLCKICPLNLLCKAYPRNLQAEFPVKALALKRTAMVINYLLVNSNDQILIQKRTGKGIWKGLYELPMISGDLGKLDLVAEYEEKYGLKMDNLKEVSRVKQNLTHAELDIRFYSAPNAEVKPDRISSLLTIPVGKIENYPFPKPLVDFLNKP